MSITFKRKQPEKFEPEKWNKLDPVDRNKQYDIYMEWCGGIEGGKNYDNVDLHNLKKEDNLYKKLIGYILICRRYESKLVWDGSSTYNLGMDEKEFQDNMNDFRKLLKDNLEEIILNLGYTKWITSILRSFVHLGTDREKFNVLILIGLLSLNRIDLSRGRTLFTEDFLMNESQIKFFIKSILPLENKNFENIFKTFLGYDKAKYNDTSSHKVRYDVKSHNILKKLVSYFNMKKYKSPKNELINILKDIGVN